MNPDLHDLWVVIPAYNEASVIRTVLEGLRPLGCHIVVVDDGSADGTGEAARLPGVNLLRHITNVGQGAAIQTGFVYCLRRGARYVGTFDADDQHDPESLRNMFRSLVETGSDVALGSRTLGSSQRIPLSRSLLLMAAVWFTWIHSGIRVTDTHNGLRILTAHAVRTLRLTQPRMAHASEILREIASRKLKFVEVPVTVRYTNYSLGKGQGLSGAFRILLDLFFTMVA
ncbi:MAG: glycosyltransferase family 2 protein [Bryobacteraceae bacterium]